MPLKVVADPTLAPNILNASTLDQVAWLLNNVQVGVDTAVSPQLWFGQNYTDCGPITVADLQVRATHGDGSGEMTNARPFHATVYGVGLARLTELLQSSAVEPKFCTDQPLQHAADAARGCERVQCWCALALFCM